MVEKIADSVLADGGRFSKLVSAIVHSDPFQKRGGAEGSASPSKTDRRRTIREGPGERRSRCPWLEADGTARRRREGAARGTAPKRMAFFYVPNGVRGASDWTPKGTGAGLVLPDILKPLEPIKDDLLVLTGLTQDGAFAHGDGGGDHAPDARQLPHRHSTRSKSGRPGHQGQGLA